MPSEVTAKISKRAADIARQLAPKNTGKGAESLMPTSAEGVIGIKVPEETSYMLVQDQGAEPRIMYELAGKVIPIRGPNGRISFRKATNKNIGKKIVSRDENGALVTKVSWRHPGIEGKHFIEKGIRQSVSEWAQTATAQELIRVLDDSDVQVLMDILRGRQ